MSYLVRLVKVLDNGGYIIQQRSEEYICRIQKD